MRATGPLYGYLPTTTLFVLPRVVSLGLPLSGVVDNPTLDRIDVHPESSS